MLEDSIERLWCTTGYIYLIELSELAEKAGKQKP